MTDVFESFERMDKILRNELIRVVQKKISDEEALA
jgi:hypothetical protein